MWIFGIIVFLVLIICVCALIQTLKDDAKEKESLNIPYRVAKNGIGKYVLQHYKKIIHDYTTDDPRDLGYHYEWVTIHTYDDLQDAKIQYRVRLAEIKYKQEKEAEKKKSIEELKKKQEQENKIVEIIKIED